MGRKDPPRNSHPQVDQRLVSSVLTPVRSVAAGHWGLFLAFSLPSV